MVNSVSDLGQSSYIMSMVQSTQQQLDTVQAQISSGRKADTYAGLGATNTYQSVSLRGQLNQLNAFSNAIDSVTPITSAMDSAMTNITSVSQSLTTALQSVVQGTTDPGMTTFNAQAQNALTSIQQYLNTQVNNTYVFAASDSSTPPVASTTALNTAVQTDLAAYVGGSETATQVMTNVAAYTPTQNGYATTLAAATDVSVNTNTNVSTDYTVKADNPGFQNIMQGLSIIANLQYNSSDPAGFYKIYNGAVNLINSGTSQVTQSQATLGIATKAMTDTQTQIGITQSMLNTSIVNAEDLSSDDLAKASSQVTDLETQLQSSYTLIGQLKSLHLIDFLNGSA